MKVAGISREPLVIAYGRDLPGIPVGYAVYTAAELEYMGTLQDYHTISLIHTAKKYGAEILIGGLPDEKKPGKKTKTFQRKG